MKPEPVLERLSRCPRHGVTPLVSVPELAAKLQLAEVWVKDESRRMGLGSFKSLGGAYAVSRWVERLGPEQTFCCASAGNHGLSVAAGAQAFGSRAVIFLSATVPQAFEQRIRDIGAEVVRAGANYEESMKEAQKKAAGEGWVLVSDSSWPGNLETPGMIMEGYTVIGWECAQFFRRHAVWPTHVFLQAGVGGMAAALTRQIRSDWDEQPEIVVVEPDQAACLMESHRAGKPVSVTGQVSNMGRLDCKEPSLLAFEILHAEANSFMTITDNQAAGAAELLAEAKFPTTPSGAAGLAGAMCRELGPESRILILVTEEGP